MKDIRITILVDEDLHKAINLAATKLGLSMSEYIRFAVLKDLRQNRGYEGAQELFVVDRKTIKLLQYEMRKSLIDEIADRMLDEVLQTIDKARIKKSTIDDALEQAWEKIAKKL